MLRGLLTAALITGPAATSDAEDGFEITGDCRDAKGWQDVTIEPAIPEKFGGYAVIVALEGQDRLFGASCVRTSHAPRLVATGTGLGYC